MREGWFPITGHIILRGNKPIASVPDSEEVFKIMEALTHNNPGQDYTCIGNDGWHTSICSPEKTEDK